MDYKHFTSFNLTDPKTGITKNLTDDFGGIIININEEVYERECMPQINFVTIKNDFTDGELFMDAHYGIRTIDITVMFDETGADLFELKKWLGKKYQQIFNWDNDDEDIGIYAIESGSWQSQVYYTKKFFGKINLKFICHNPYYFKLKDRNITFTNMVLNQDYIVRSKGNSNSYPLIKITPSSTSVVFKWNDLIVTLSNLTIGNPIYLDCEKCVCYEVINDVKTLATAKFYSNTFYDFPEIDVDIKNTVKVTSGNIAEIIIYPSTRII